MSWWLSVETDEKTGEKFWTATWGGPGGNPARFKTERERDAYVAESKRQGIGHSWDTGRQE